MYVCFIMQSHTYFVKFLRLSTFRALCPFQLGIYFVLYSSFITYLRCVSFLATLNCTPFSWIEMFCPCDKFHCFLSLLTFPWILGYFPKVIVNISVPIKPLFSSWSLLPLPLFHFGILVIDIHIEDVWYCNSYDSVVPFTTLC